MNAQPGSAQAIVIDRLLEQYAKVEAALRKSLAEAHEYRPSSALCVSLVRGAKSVEG